MGKDVDELVDRSAETTAAGTATHWLEREKALDVPDIPDHGQVLTVRLGRFLEQHLVGGASLQALGGSQVQDAIRHRPLSAQTASPHRRARPPRGRPWQDLRGCSAVSRYGRRPAWPLPASMPGLQTRRRPRRIEPGFPSGRTTGSTTATSCAPSQCRIAAACCTAIFPPPSRATRSLCDMSFRIQAPRRVSRFYR